MTGCCPLQVNELDVALRSHQADTTSRRLQLERALTQRQADLRSRTQEVCVLILPCINAPHLQFITIR